MDVCSAQMALSLMGKKAPREPSVYVSRELMVTKRKALIIGVKEAAC